MWSFHRRLAPVSCTSGCVIGCVIGCVGGCIVVPAGLHAQCSPGWFPGNGYSSGFNGTIEALASWDADDDGPLAPLLVAGGSFRAIGPAPFEHIAAWNGTSWTALGAGLGFSPRALAVYNGELVAAGSFNPAGGAISSIARWDGASWRPLGAGLNAQVNALLVHEDRLFVGGEFTLAGNVPVSSIAVWDGVAWEDVGGGVSGVIVPMVSALVSIDEGVVAGGFFTHAGGHPALHIARWDGAQWHALGAGRASPVSTLHVFEGKVIAGSTDEAAGNIAAWDGSAWVSLGLGVNRRPSALMSYRGTLVATGDFTAAGGAPANSMARWNGQEWRPFGLGLGSSFTIPRGQALTVYRDQVAVGGFFESAGGQPSVFFARWSDGADFNMDGATNSQDFFDFLAAFFASVPSADYNGDGDINSQDFFDFVAALFGGC